MILLCESLDHETWIMLRRNSSENLVQIIDMCVMCSQRYAPRKLEFMYAQEINLK